MPAPVQARIVAAASTRRAKHVAAAKADKNGVTPSHKKAPTQQLAARKHKTKHKNQEAGAKIAGTPCSRLFVLAGESGGAIVLLMAQLAPPAAPAFSALSRGRRAHELEP